MTFTEMLEAEIQLAEQEIVAFARDYMADRFQGLIEGPLIPPMRDDRTWVYDLVPWQSDV